MDNFWRRLQKMVMDFKTDTEEKRRNYNELLSKDKKGVAEVAESLGGVYCFGGQVREERKGRRSSNGRR